MADEAPGAVVADDFPGLITNSDSSDIPPGAAEIQVNITCVRFGELQVRRGLRQIVFEGE